ncbi:PLDc N-terminal domain-containing protein [soil metagenome]
MLYFDGALGLALFLLWVFCLIDVITTDASSTRNLQKMWWVLIVVLLFDVGAVLWLVAGRPWQGAAQGRGLPYRGNTGTSPFPEYERPGRFAASNPDDDEAFLRQVRERAEEQRRQYRDQQRRDEADDS